MVNSRITARDMQRAKSERNQLPQTTNFQDDIGVGLNCVPNAKRGGAEGIFVCAFTIDHYANWLRDSYGWDLG